MIGLTSSRELDSSGFDRANQKRSETFGIVEVNPARLPLFKELVEDGIVNVLARPTLMTSAGRPAAMHIGGEVPVRIEISSAEMSVRNVPIGTYVEVLPVVLPNHRVRLRMALEKREISSAKTDGDDGASYPEVQSRRIHTEVEMNLGQTVTLAGLIVGRRRETETPGRSRERNESGRALAKNSDPSGTTQTIVFITPQLVPSRIMPRALHVPPEAEPEDESSESVEPAVFEPVDWDSFGPPIPVLRRRAWGD
jgi:pilus assembly protein CpaC